jgi:16S rRNA (uracil1498-N3)-methyltransferase
MPRFFVPGDRLSAPRVHLEEAEARYLGRVLRLVVGDEVVAFDGTGHECDGVVRELSARGGVVEVLTRRHAPERVGPELTLVMGLPKGDKLELVVQKATELGVGRIVPVATARSIPQPAAARVARWKRIAQEAARQSGRADVPDVVAPAPLAQVLTAAPDTALRLLFWEQSRAVRLRDVLPARPPAQVWVAVGPEGGFTPDEASRAQVAGFAAVGLGPRTLRAETAALVALALVGYTLGDIG